MPGGNKKGHAYLSLCMRVLFCYHQVLKGNSSSLTSYNANWKGNLSRLTSYNANWIHLMWVKLKQRALLDYIPFL